MVTEQGILGSAAVMSLVSLSAQGGAWGEVLPSTQLFCNRCWTRLEGKFKELGVGWGEKGPVDRVRALGQADLGPRPCGREQAGAPGISETDSGTLGAKAGWVVGRARTFRLPVFPPSLFASLLAQLPGQGSWSD